LDRFANQLADIGVKRLNISLDTLRAEKFKEITRWGSLDKVMNGIQAAKQAGLKVKINVVALRNTNEDELHDFVSWCGQEDFDLTFIEVMPMGDFDEENRLSQYWSMKDLRKELEKKWTLEDINLQTGGPARYVKVTETKGRIGFITPLSHNFCESCNRVRLTCTGQLFMCLGQEDEADLRKVIRENPNDDGLLQERIHQAISLKPKGHDFDYSRRKVEGQIPRFMSLTGG
jgi:cyclic pyranopterin phosphate synthase